MKALFLLTYYAPHWTGLTEHARRLAEALAQEDVGVTVVTTQHEHSLLLKEEIRAVTIVRSPVLFRLSRTLISPGLLWKAWQEIGKTDTVIIYTPIAEVFIFSLFAKLQQKRLILLHNGDLLLPKGLLNRILEKIFDITGFLSACLADHLIAYSDDYAKNSRFFKPFLKKTTAILPLFPPQKVEQSVIKTLQKKLPNHASLIIGFAGRFVEEKGFDLLLQAIPLVINKIPDALFVFAGETHMVYEHFFEKNQSLFTPIGNYFYSFGLLSQEEMAGFYQLLNVFVLPSRSDCLAFVQVEALLSGVPVVVTDIPGARVPVKTTGMGELVRPEDPASLATGIVSVVQKQKTYQQQLPEVKKLFDYEKSLKAFKKVLFP